MGTVTVASTPKKKATKLYEDEVAVVQIILNKVYEAMEQDNVTGTFTDGGRITISLTGEQMYDLFEAKRKLQ